VLGSIVAVQTLHCIEHVVQLYQYAVLHEPNPKGLLGVWFDREWVHFFFNLTVGGLLLALFVGFRMYERRWQRSSPLGWWALTAAIVVEVGLHVPEHAVRLYQHVVYGWNPAPGILGHTALHGAGPFNLVYLHDAYNFTVTALLIVALVCFRVPRWSRSP
jgi:hypothetical protein